MSDEERMIEKLAGHREVKEATMRSFRKAGIPCHETVHNDSRGDISIERKTDFGRVRKIISGWSGEEI